MNTKTLLFPLLGVLALSLSAPVSASTVLADNLTEIKNGTVAIREDTGLQAAQSFTTTASAYRITDVAVPISKSSGSSGTLTLAIYSATGGINPVPDSQLAVVADVDASQLGSSSSLFNQSSLNILLTPSTTYYLVLKSIGAAHFAWDYTNSIAGTGFPSYFTSISALGNPWDTPSLASPQKMRIVAETVVPLPGAALLMGSALAVLRVFKRRTAI